jgi:adenosine deaminase
MQEKQAIDELPKIDLHHHLDGAIRTETIRDLAQEQGIDLPTYDVEELNDHVRVSKDCRSLSDFLECFEVLYPVIQTPEAMNRIAYELCETLEKHGVIYAETRFAPVLITEGGASQREVVEAVLDGLDRGQSDYDVTVNLILCVYRGTPPESGLTTVDLAREYRDRGVVAIDLAGDESQYEASDHARAFEKAREYDLNMTVHAGEAGEVDNVAEALDLGGDRIGHGVRLIDDPDLTETVAEREIPLEICLTSNVQTGVVPSYEDHPVTELREKGVRVTLNTDDPAISNIDINHEFRVAHERLGFTFPDLKRILVTSAESAFADPTEKESLRETIKQFQP